MLSGIRQRISEDLELIKPGDVHFSWVAESRMFRFDDKEKPWVALHHASRPPRPQDLGLLDSRLRNRTQMPMILSLNGDEAVRGSIQIHDKQLRKRVLKLVGMTPESVKEQFGALLDVPQVGGVRLMVELP